MEHVKWLDLSTYKEIAETCSTITRDSCTNVSSSIISNATKSSDLVWHRQSNSNKIARAFLCEPLAVHTVMSYLREEMIYYVLINRFFSCLQVNNADQRSISKIAENILTTVNTLPSYIRLFSDWALVEIWHFPPRVQRHHQCPLSWEFLEQWFKSTKRHQNHPPGWNESFSWSGIAIQQLLSQQI